MKENSGKVYLGLILAISMVSVFLFVFDNYRENRIVDISGKWNVVFYIDKSKFSDFVGKNTTTRMLFTQKDDQIKAEGQMIQFDMKDLPASEQIPLHFEGKIIKDKIQIFYTQDDKNRKTVGEINVLISLTGEIMEGTFSGKAARSSGRVKAKKLVK